LGDWLLFSFELEGTAAEPGRSPQIGAIVTSPDYFQVMRVKATRGRIFRESDGVVGLPVALVNESFAAKYWADENPLGKRLRLMKDHVAQPWLTVVGLLPDILQDGRRPLDHEPLIYLPYAEEPQQEIFIVAKTHVTPNTLVEAFRRAVKNIDPNLPVYDVRTLESRLEQNRLSVRVFGGMLSVFAAIALVLASIGLYAVITHSISQRTQEIGVRMAVGGTRGDILRLVYAQGMRPLVFGMALGLPAAFGVTHLLRMALIGVSPGDPLTFLTAMLVLIITGILGCAIPARRAIQIDPIVALRYE
jgi:putative ABC transport system permease protein